MSRSEDRTRSTLRSLTMETGVAPYAEGSCLITAGSTRVLCTASVEEGVPRWRESSGEGWVTAEYAMLPRATHTRTSRERGRVGGRTQEIQRLIGRSLRSVVDMGALGPRSVLIDCDVLQADGGTRTASITGAAVALAQATRELVRKGLIEHDPIREWVAAISVGIVDGQPRLDLDYNEDSSAQVDMNIVATETEKLVEVQGTAEGHPFSRSELDQLIDLGLAGIGDLVEAQRVAMEG